MKITLSCGRCLKDNTITLNKRTPNNIQCRCGNYLVKDGIAAKRKG